MEILWVFSCLFQRSCKLAKWGEVTIRSRNLLQGPAGAGPQRCRLYRNFHLVFDYISKWNWMMLIYRSLEKTEKSHIVTFWKCREHESETKRDVRWLQEGERKVSEGRSKLKTSFKSFEKRNLKREGEKGIGNFTGFWTLLWRRDVLSSDQVEASWCPRRLNS